MVSIDEVNVLREPVAVSIKFNLLMAEEVKVFNEPVEVSIAVNLPIVEELNVFKLLVDVSIEFSLPLAEDVKELTEPVCEPNSTSDTKLLSNDELKLSKLPTLVLKDELAMSYEDVKEWKLEVNVYFGASDAVNALVVVPLTVAYNVPKTVKSP